MVTILLVTETTVVVLTKHFVVVTIEIVPTTILVCCGWFVESTYLQNVF